MIKGHHLTWGIPAGGVGWTVLGNSVPDMARTEEHKIVACAAIGAANPLKFTEGLGYFGKHQGKDTWAVFAHFYRSSELDKSGRSFVQSDIGLAPLREFRVQGYDAQPFLASLPEPRVFRNSGERNAPWTIELTDTRAARLQRLGDAPFTDDDFLTRLLLAFLQPHPTVVVWSQIDMSTLTAVLLLYPAVLRERMTFFTNVAELASAQVHIKCVDEYRSEPGSSLVEMDKCRFTQWKIVIESTLPKQLVKSLRDGTLQSLHDYIHTAVAPIADHVELVKALDQAVEQWQSIQTIAHELTGARRWTSASDHLKVMSNAFPDVAAANRRVVFETLLDNFDPSQERDAFVSFVQELRPDMSERSHLFAKAGERLAASASDARKTLVSAFVAALGPDTLEDLASETFQRFPENQKRIENVQALESLFTNKRTTDLPHTAVENVLAGWTFLGPTQWDLVFKLLSRVTSGDRLSLLEKNERLLRTLQADPSARLALELIRLQFGANNESSIIEEVQRYPGEAAHVVTSGLASHFEGKAPLALRVIAEIVVAKHEPSLADSLAESFTSHLEKVSDPALLQNEQIRKAIEWVASKDKYRERISTARARLEAFNAEETLRSALRAPVTQWESKKAPIASVLALISGMPRWTWYLASDLYDDREFNLAGFCGALLTEKRGAMPLQRALAMLVLLEPDRPRSDAADVLSLCVEAIVAARPMDTELRGKLESSWTPSGHAGYGHLLALLHTHRSRADLNPLRRAVLRRLQPEEQVMAIAARVDEIAGVLSEFARGAELDRLKDILKSNTNVDLRDVERAVHSLLDWLDDAEFRRSLKNNIRALQKNGKELPWTNRP